MVWHVILFKLKDNISELHVEQMMAGLRGLEKKIPQIERMHVGLNLSNRGQGHSVMALSCFKTKQDLQAYTEHPEHRRVVSQFIDPIRESVTVADIDCS